jgi:proteasome lid subunit RPN8/RPN11
MTAMNLDRLLPAMFEHARAEMPRESCGLIVVAKGRRRYVPCRNLAGGAGQFVLCPQDYAAAEDKGEVLAVVHSHPDAAPVPTLADRAGIESTGLPWVIVNPRTEAHTVTEPSGFVAPLVGRPFVWGVHDCYGLIRDYYRAALCIDLPDFAREEEFWLRGQNLYVDNFGQAGFAPAEGPLRRHDVLLMKTASPVPNHGAVLADDGVILHHVAGRLASREVYGGYWRKVTTHVLRHRSLA